MGRGGRAFFFVCVQGPLPSSLSWRHPFIKMTPWRSQDRDQDQDQDQDKDKDKGQDKDQDQDKDKDQEQDLVTWGWLLKFFFQGGWGM